MEYKVLAFHEAFDVLESSLNKWAAEGWRMAALWQPPPPNGYMIRVVLERPEEAHDAAGEAWQAGAYPSGVTDPGETSGPRGLG